MKQMKKQKQVTQITETWLDNFMKTTSKMTKRKTLAYKIFVRRHNVIMNLKNDKRVKI